MENKLRCIIVEDEPIHGNRLKKLLAAADQDIEIIAVCASIEDAFDKISRHSPQLVFLDIQLQANPRGGFELLKKFRKPQFDVVFTTAHVDKNIEDIRRCGITYMLKPYVKGELEASLKKVYEKRDGNIGIRQLDTLLHNLVTEQLDEQLIWLGVSEGNIPVKIKNIVYCKAFNQYTTFYVIHENKKGEIKKITISRGIGEWTKILTPLKFCRCHDSYIINIRHIAKIVRKSGHVYLHQIEAPVSLSPSGRERLDALIKKTTPVAFR